MRRLVLLGLALLSIGLAILAVISVWLGSWPLALGGAGAGIVGATILGKRPGNGVGRALLAFGMATVLSDLATGYMSRWLAGVPLPLDRFAVTLGASVFVLVGTTGCALLLVYPNGVARGRWRWVLRAVLTVGVIGALAGVIWSAGKPVAEVARAMISNTDSDNPGELAAAITFALAFPVSVVSLLARYRAAGTVERAQVRWLVLAAGVLLISSVGQNIAGDFDSSLSQTTTAIAFVLFPMAIGVAITRYRLFEIDRIISRTVSYGLLTALLIGVYVGLVFLLRQLLPIEGGFPVATSTLAAAALFNPLRKRVQVAVDRRFNRSRYDAERVVEDFSARLRGAVDLDGLTDDLHSVTIQTVQPASAGVWLRMKEQS